MGMGGLSRMSDKEMGEGGGAQILQALTFLCYYLLQVHPDQDLLMGQCPGAAGREQV